MRAGTNLSRLLPQTITFELAIMFHINRRRSRGAVEFCSAAAAASLCCCGPRANYSQIPTNAAADSAKCAQKPEQCERGQEF